MDTATPSPLIVATFPLDEHPASDRIRRTDQASDEQPLQLRRIDVRIFARGEALPEPADDEAEPRSVERLAGRGELCDDVFAIPPLVEHPDDSTPRRSRWYRGGPRRPAAGTAPRPAASRAGAHTARGCHGPSRRHWSETAVDTPQPAMKASCAEQLPRARHLPPDTAALRWRSECLPERNVLPARLIYSKPRTISTSLCLTRVRFAFGAVAGALRTAGRKKAARAYDALIAATAISEDRRPGAAARREAVPRRRSII